MHCRFRPTGHPIAHFASLICLFALLLLPSLAHGAAPPAVADESLDRTTPRRAFEGFQSAAADGDYDRAAKYLDLRGLTKTKAESQGPELARELAYVISRRFTLDPATIPDAPDAGRTTGSVTVGSLYVEEEPIYLNVTHVKFSDGVSRWLIAKTTVSEIPQLDAAYGPKPWEESMPRVLRSPYVLGNAPWQWVGLIVALALGLVVARLLAQVLTWIARRLLKRARPKANNSVLLLAKPALRAIIATLVFRLLARSLALTVDVDEVVSRVTGTLLVLTIAWLVIRVIGVVTTVIEDAALEAHKNELESRGLRTQLTILHRIGAIVVGVLAFAAVLLQFAVVRSVGTSLLASAGVAGIVLGLAAQKSLGAIIAGIQLSLAQPVRIGDTVVVETQLGKVEELHLTYVVVKLWDERRLIVPIGKFLDQSFENWTKQGTDLRGEVLVLVNYLTPISTVRAELQKICEESKLWDKRICTLHVSDSNDRGMTLRALVSAHDADTLFELRCHVRERLLNLVASIEGGKHLARARSEVHSVTAGPA